MQNFDKQSFEKQAEMAETNLSQFEGFTTSTSTSRIVSDLCRVPSHDYPANANWPREKAQLLISPALVQAFEAEGVPTVFIAQALSGIRDRRSEAMRKESPTPITKDGIWQLCTQEKAGSLDRRGLGRHVGMSQGKYYRFLGNTSGLLIWAAKLVKALEDRGVPTSELQEQFSVNDPPQLLLEAATWYLKAGKHSSGYHSDYQADSSIDAVLAAICIDNDWTGSPGVGEPDAQKDRITSAEDTRRDLADFMSRQYNRQDEPDRIIPAAATQQDHDELKLRRAIENQVDAITKAIPAAGKALLRSLKATTKGILNLHQHNLSSDDLQALKQAVDNRINQRLEQLAAEELEREYNQEKAQSQ
jgi:hypothetical protein